MIRINIFENKSAQSEEIGKKSHNVNFSCENPNQAGFGFSQHKVWNAQSETAQSEGYLYLCFIIHLREELSTSFFIADTLHFSKNSFESSFRFDIFYHFYIQCF